jgi:mannose-6-phosphate isomerase-like protein (cupin superfamily)
MFVTKEIIDTILENKQKGTTCVIKNFCTEVPSWNDFIQYIEESSYEASSFADPLPEYDLNLGGKVVGNILIKQDLYLYIGSHRHIGNSEAIVQEFQAFKPMFGMANLYVNLSSKISNIPPHSDPLDNFYWQCQGTVEWVANGSTYIVESGDLVYIPAKTSHAVNFSVPRAAIGFSVDLNG